MFRCPGGKRRIAGTIVEGILRQCGDQPLTSYCEPFAATASVCLHLLRTVGGVRRVWLNDVDRGTFALWWCVLNEPDDFLRLVGRFKPSKRAFLRFKRDLLMGGAGLPLAELALQKVACHQMSFSGLGAMAGGAMTEVGSRWSPRHIRRNVEEARRLLAGREVRITNMDYKRVLREIDADTFVFLDPPFYRQGSVLYQHSFAPADHAELAAMLRSSRFKWLLSYDDCPEVRGLYDGDEVREVRMKYTIHTVTRKNELLIAPKAHRMSDGPLPISSTTTGDWPGTLMGPGDAIVNQIRPVFDA